MESVTTPLSYMCLLLVVVESVDFVHLDLNSKKALRLGISHIIHLAVRETVLCASVHVAVYACISHLCEETSPPD